MGCIENLKYEMILPLGASFKECREYAEKNFKEVWYVDPGYKLFDEYIIGLPPIALGIEDGKKIIFPYTKPCHGTYLLRIEDPDEVERVTKGGEKEKIISLVKKIMKKQWLVRYSEIFLKSDPVRCQWENVLIANIREMMPDVHVRNERGRIWLDGDVKPDRLKNIFGIVSFSEVEHIRIDELELFLPNYCRRHGIEKAKTFAIKMKRVGTHTFSSNDKAIEYGNLLRKGFPHLKVNLAHPDMEIHIEIRANEAYLYDTVIKAVGGLPLGVEGTFVALVSGGIDSPVAAWMMMKRGCRIIPLFVAIDTFLDETTIARAQRVVNILAKFQPGIELTVVSDSYLAVAKEELIRRHLEKYTCIFCKRRMYRVATAYATKTGAKGIVTGESLGQVASQTLDNLAVLTDAAGIPIYRPLIGFDKEETIRIAQEIGTFEQSTSHASGCKAVPKGPSTKAKLDTIREIEGKLEATGMPLPVI